MSIFKTVGGYIAQILKRFSVKTVSTISAACALRMYDKNVQKYINADVQSNLNYIYKLIRKNAKYEKHIVYRCYVKDAVLNKIIDTLQELKYKVKVEHHFWHVNGNTKIIIDWGHAIDKGEIDEATV